MMIARLTPLAVVLAGALASAGAAAATPIFFAAGEHGEYSRVVLSPGAEEASVTQNGRTLTILLPNDARDVNIDELTQRRRAHRVAGASVTPSITGSIVSVELNCDCTMERRTLANGKVVLDVRDRSGSTSTRSAADNTPSNVAPKAASPAQPAPAKPTPMRATPPTPASLPTPAALQADEDRLSVEKAHSRMLDLLRQAADEGLISLKSDANTTPADTAAPVAAAEEADDSQIRIATIKPDETPPRPQTPPPATRGAAARACLDDDAFSLNADQFESDPLGAISEMQANLAHADTSTQRSIAEDLAAGFISIGFGEEALAVLAEHGADVSLHGEMARAVANLPLPPAGAILGAADCEGAHALWQALSEPADRATGPAARSRDAIDTLPTRLKRLAATRIARKMADAGAWKQTKRFFEIAKEGADPSSPDLAFIEAMLKENEGRASEAEDKLLEIAATNTQASQDALVALAERYVDGDRPHEGFLDDIGTVAKTQRGSETGAQAAILEGVAYADAGHIEAGVLLLRHAAESGAADAAIARSEARRIITRAAKETNEKVNLAALTAYLDNREFVDEPDSSPEFRTSLATTALKVGLANVAFKVIRNDPSSDATVAHMKARAAIEAKAPNEAIAAAAQHADKQAFAELVAEANLRLENYYAAIAAASVLPDGDRRAMLTAQAAWRAGDWETAARAFASLNPSLMGEALAVQYGLAAYMSGARELPNLSAAVLQSANSSSLPGLRQLFEDRPTGSVLARGKAVVRQSHDEIELIEKALDNG